MHNLADQSQLGCSTQVVFVHNVQKKTFSFAGFYTLLLQLRTLALKRIHLRVCCDCVVPTIPAEFVHV